MCGRPAADHRCPECGDTRMRAAVVGARRTAEELGRAFPGVVVRTSGGDNVLDIVSDKPALIVSTPGAEPVAEGGYSAALLLDTWLLLARPDLRAPEEAVRRWFNAAALGPRLDRRGDPGRRTVRLAAAGGRPLESRRLRGPRDRGTPDRSPCPRPPNWPNSPARPRPSPTCSPGCAQLLPATAGLEVLGPVDVDDEAVASRRADSPRAGSALVARVEGRAVGPQREEESRLGPGPGRPAKLRLMVSAVDGQAEWMRSAVGAQRRCGSRARPGRRGGSRPRRRCAGCSGGRSTSAPTLRAGGPDASSTSAGPGDPRSPPGSARPGRRAVSRSVSCRSSHNRPRPRGG